MKLHALIVPASLMEQGDIRATCYLYENFGEGDQTAAGVVGHPDENTLLPLTAEDLGDAYLYCPAAAITTTTTSTPPATTPSACTTSGGTDCVFPFTFAYYNYSSSQQVSETHTSCTGTSAGAEEHGAFAGRGLRTCEGRVPVGRAAIPCMCTRHTHTHTHTHTLCRRARTCP